MCTRTLTVDDLLICDANDVPIGLGGMMGGADSEIADGTTIVALEVAWFEPIGIAASVNRIGLRCDASVRFERGVDPYSIDLATARFVELLAETCPDLVVHAGAVDARPGSLRPRAPETGTGEPGEPDPRHRLKRDDVAALIDPIGFGVSGDDPEALTVALPTWRPDSTEEIDVVEEVGRHYGYERIPSWCRSRRCTAS